MIGCFAGLIGFVKLAKVSLRNKESVGRFRKNTIIGSANFAGLSVMLNFACY